MKNDTNDQVVYVIKDWLNTHWVIKKKTSNASEHKKTSGI